MRIEFDETVPLDPNATYAWFRSPQDWSRLYEAFGEVKDRGDGWFSVPLQGFPFPLVARVMRDVPAEHVSWEIKGFFRGRGEVRLHAHESGTVVTGFEDLKLPGLLGLGRVIDRKYFLPRFRRVWISGWRRLRAAGEPARR